MFEAGNGPCVALPLPSSWKGNCRIRETSETSTVDTDMQPVIEEVLRKT